MPADKATDEQLEVARNNLGIPLKTDKEKADPDLACRNPPRALAPETPGTDQQPTTVAAVAPSDPRAIPSAEESGKRIDSVYKNTNKIKGLWITVSGAVSGFYFKVWDGFERWSNSLMLDYQSRRKIINVNFFTFSVIIRF